MILSETRRLIGIKSAPPRFGIIFLEYANHDDKANHHAHRRQAGP
jgi:hypothetical protein